LHNAILKRVAKKGKIDTSATYDIKFLITFEFTIAV